MRGLQHARLDGLMTHFASAADFESHQTEAQIAYFNSIVEGLGRAGLHPTYFHLASTNAIAYPRPGDGAPWCDPGMRSTAMSRPLAANSREYAARKAGALLEDPHRRGKRCAGRTLIGYGGSYRAPHALRIAILAAGYADGIPHRLSNRGSDRRWKLAPMLGTVSMDLTTIDVSHAPHLQSGDAVTLLGSEMAFHSTRNRSLRPRGRFPITFCAESARG